MSNNTKVSIEDIVIEEQTIWRIFVEKYIPIMNYDGQGNFDDTFFYLDHTREISTILHSVSSYLYSKQSIYALTPSYPYRLLKPSMLEGFFALRESLAGLTNVVFKLGEDATKNGFSHRILLESEKQGLPITKYLNELIPKTSKLNKYLEKYRHPYVHREDSGRAALKDWAFALTGKQQPRILKFITESYETSRWIQDIESHIAKECAKRLGISLNTIRKKLIL